MAHLKWRDMDDAARALAYSPSSALEGEIDPFIQSYVDKSAAAYAALPEVITLKYGQNATQTVDITLPNGTGAAPLLVFIHGGYWCQLSKRESFGPARDALCHGMGYAAIDYTLAPAASLDEIVRECREALKAIFANAAGLGIDPARILVAGNSAGAHLTAMSLLGLPADCRPCGAVLLSGIYELEPLIGTYINEPLGLDKASAARNSPAQKQLNGFPKTLIAWGRQETDEFKRQSHMFATLLAQAGTEVDLLEVETRNHFDILDDLANSSELGCKLRALAQM